MHKAAIVLSFIILFIPIKAGMILFFSIKILVKHLVSHGKNIIEEFRRISFIIECKGVIVTHPLSWFQQLDSDLFNIHHQILSTRFFHYFQEIDHLPNDWLYLSTPSLAVHLC